MRNAWPSHDSTHPAICFIQIAHSTHMGSNIVSFARYPWVPIRPCLREPHHLPPRLVAMLISHGYTNNGSLEWQKFHLCTGIQARVKVIQSWGTVFRRGNGSRGELKNINYSELPPLDGEEGELIDDEACFIDSRAVRGIGTCSSVRYGCN